MNIQILVALYYHWYERNSGTEALNGGWLCSGLKLKQEDINMDRIAVEHSNEYYVKDWLPINLNSIDKHSFWIWENQFGL